MGAFEHFVPPARLSGGKLPSPPGGRLAQLVRTPTRPRGTSHLARSFTCPPRVPVFWNLRIGRQLGLPLQRSGNSQVGERLVTLGLQGGGNLPGAESLARKFRYSDLDGHGLQGVPPIRYLLYHPFTRLGLGSTVVTALFRVSGPLSAGLRAGWGAKKTLVSQKRAPRSVHSNAPSPWLRSR